MKKSYVRPMMHCEEFAANEYVAACGDENRVYYFECDAPGGNLYYYRNGDGTIDGVYNGTGTAILLGSYHPCGDTHEASTTNPFYDGFVDRNRNQKCDIGRSNCLAWFMGDKRSCHSAAGYGQLGYGEVLN